MPANDLFPPLIYNNNMKKSSSNLIPKDLLVKVDKKSKAKKDAVEKNPDQPEPAGPFYHLKETPTKKPGPGPITIVLVLIVVIIAVFLFFYFAKQLRLEQAALFGQ
jgi:uncharacterized membrane protein